MMNRRTFIRVSGSAAAAAWTTRWLGAPSGSAPAFGEYRLVPQELAANPAGTTLESTIIRATSSGYSRLIVGPPKPTIVRDDLTPAKQGRIDRRRALASFVQLSDVHLVDVQSPGRVEFLDPSGEPFTAAFRPQELMSNHVASSMIERISQLGAGPITGRPFDCLVSTGDNIDNCQTNELDWFIRLLDGGTLTPDSGQLGMYEGVQRLADDPRWWHPDAGESDVWKDAGFPEVPGLIDAALVPFETPGVSIPWYSMYGNHDGLLQGTLPFDSGSPVDEILMGSHKLVGSDGSNAAGVLAGLIADPAAFAADLRNGTLPSLTVTADPTRQLVSPQAWVKAHIDSGDHGYTDDHFEAQELHYEFTITAATADAPAVIGLALDTGGFNSGSIGENQLVWLRNRLERGSSRYFDDAGNTVCSRAEDCIFLVFSHFPAVSMNGGPSNPAQPTMRRVDGDEVQQLLWRFPNVVGWVNGHHHANKVTPRPDPSGRTAGYWDINTASHIDYPQHARVVELVDNADGTLSIICTMLEHLAPAASDYAGRGVLDLASISRELSANDPQSNLIARLGSAEDFNVELVIPAPFPIRAACSAGPTTTVAVPPTSAPSGTAPASPAKPVLRAPTFTG